jgi:APA family basic amino acid/polyamine antiporter
MADAPNNQKLKREIGLFSAVILVIANMVGTGIFTTSGLIIKELQNPLALLICWLVGGAFALCGAFCYGELGARYPHAGGEYVFLREAYGKCIGFLSGWISLIVGFSAPIAAAAIGFAIYFFNTFGLHTEFVWHLPINGVNIITLNAHSLMAVLIVLSISIIHGNSLRAGSRVQNLLTVFKVGFILIFIILGVSIGQGSASHFGGPLEWPTLFQDKFAVSLIFVSFAYSGWNAAAYLGGEIKKPKKNIPLALFTGTLLVTLFYLLLNTVYIFALDMTQMSGAIDVGARAAVHLFGEDISRYISAAIAVGLLSVLSAMIMTGPRVYYAMAKDKIFFKTFGSISKKGHTPGHSIILQASIAILMIVTASYDKLLLYIGFTLSMFAMLTVIGLIIIRMRKPHPKGQYKAFGYPITPALFIIGNLWIVYFSIKNRPVPALMGIITIGAGLCVYGFFQRKRHAPIKHHQKGKRLLKFHPTGVAEP